MFQCRDCDYAFFASTKWLDDAYGQAVGAKDIGLRSRSGRNLHRIRALLAVPGLTCEPVPDYGGGYGTLTRMLRDSGVDCHHRDP